MPKILQDAMITGVVLFVLLVFKQISDREYAKRKKK
jgi:hypothetical protein